jgi:hypothetical protein
MRSKSSESNSNMAGLGNNPVQFFST